MLTGPRIMSKVKKSLFVGMGLSFMYIVVFHSTTSPGAYKTCNRRMGTYIQIDQKAVYVKISSTYLGLNRPND